MPEPCSCPWYLLERLPGKGGADDSSHKAALPMVIRSVINLAVKRGQKLRQYCYPHEGKL